MSIYKKLSKAKSTTWLTKGIPKWQIKLLTTFAKIKAKIILSKNCKIGGNVMVTKMDFTNLTIWYDRKMFVKSTVNKIAIIEMLGFFLVYLYSIAGLFVGFFCINKINHSIYLWLFNIGVMIVIPLVGCMVINKITKKIKPKHYDFVARLMKYNFHEIQIEQLGNKYVVFIWEQRYRFIEKNLDDFINQTYQLEDKANKSEPIHMLIDLMNEEVKVTVKNHERRDINYD